ncbi:hypothetical protein [Anaeroselena agilis]|uniref:Uncharacterized protein n=1 Tax=Anaeroselena agilis TaxID=3063788 RepID=A0ABU3NVW8_9FIRM|nr:hypothetical protein [Selenomonadales bacterium 4137-cl]
MVTIDRKIIAGLLIALLVVGGYAWYLRSGTADVHDNGGTTQQIRASEERLEKRIVDLEAECQSLRDSINRSRQEVEELRGIISGLSDLNRESTEAIDRSEDRVRELEDIIRQVREGNQGGDSQSQVPEDGSDSRPNRSSSR